jgi:trk system potassium uptake protein TrkH
MGTYEAFAHALSTVGTGSFSTEPESIGAFGGITQWTVVALMVLAGANLLLVYRAVVLRRPREVARDEELRLYLAILALAGTTVAVILLARGPEGGEAGLRAAVFEVTSVITTTGYFTTDYGQWPTAALMALILLFFVGGCAGSTAGSIKVVRHLLVARLVGREVVRTLQPELVRPVRYNGAVVDGQTLFAVTAFVLVYVAVFVAGTAALALDAALQNEAASALDLVFASASTLGNAGVGLGEAGPTGSFASFGDGSTVVMTLLMWVGRLEIIPVVVLLRRGYWRV